MKRKLFFFCLSVALLSVEVCAQDAEHDSVDVLHYSLTLDLGHNVEKQLQGIAEITFVKTRDCGSVSFDLIADSIHPVMLNGVVTRGFSYNADDQLLTIYVGGMPGDTQVVTIPYFTKGHVESYGFGGMHMDNNIHYNLGAAFREYPHVFGRCFYPCRDNFYDKATYTYIVTSKPGWRSLCSGQRVSSVTNSDGSLTEEWQLSQPIPTYISSVSSAPWNIIETTYAGEPPAPGADSVRHPAILGYIGMNHDSSNVQAHFAMLNKVVPMFERCFGPYRWERIGYISTTMGSMEHAQNIALVTGCMSALNNLPCTMTTCHELGHAWFGNLITCATEGDMWINEGGASFCEEVACEAIFGRDRSDKYYLDNLGTVMRTAHVNDNGFRALSGMPELYTYGTTSYDKGALVWHSLRGIMGDSLFYTCMRRLFDRCAFGNLDAASLRDSLSQYSGIDLEGFFDFHVFHPGFIDYAVDQFTHQGNTATVTLRQQLRGTTHYAHGNRVPVTFFSNDNQQVDQWMLFDDTVATQSFSLPFEPAYAVVDYNNLISDASTSCLVTLTSQGVTELPFTYSKVRVAPRSTPINSRMHIVHHFVHPTGDTLPGIVRLSDRYWEVAAYHPWDTGVTLQLCYNMGANGTLGCSFLDRGFYENRFTFDSLGVVYRPDANHPWQLVSQKRTNNSSVVAGWFVANLMPGQYALAVVDTSCVGIPSTPVGHSSNTQLRIYPNPCNTEFRIDMGGYDKKIDLSIYDLSGKKVLSIRNLRDGDTVRHQLRPGSYVALFENKFLSLQSQIIVQ